MTRLKLLTVSTIIAALISMVPVHAQAQNTLDQTFSEILDKAESYQDYKVIRTSKLREFRSSMYDSLTSYKSTISSLKQDLAKVRLEMEDLKGQFIQVQQSLEETQAGSDLIGFLWFDVKKNTYSIILWSFISLLVLCLGIMYVRIKHVCEVVKRVKTAYSKIVEDYRNQRFQSTEKQIKLKRELQTALNRLENLQNT